jgi:hypothetical protein
MNLQHIVNEIEKVDPEVYAKLDTRRNTMRRFAFVGKVLATAAIPSAFGSMFKKAYGQSTTDIVGVLNYALTLEYLEAEFYTTAVSKGTTLIPTGAATSAFTTIRDHENAHVKFLQDTIKALGATPVSKPTFDFSGGMGSGNGPFKDAFTNYDLLLAVAQVFEDTGVRAYKGQADKLMSNNDVLTAALQIHSVEARHASHIRYMRRAKGTLIPAGVTVKPWITLAQSGIDSGSASVNALIQKSYAGEDLTTQAGVAITNINGKEVSAAAASEAFDEPLTKEQVLDIVAPFIKP